MAAKRQWSDLSGRTRGLLIAAAVVDVGVRLEPCYPGSPELIGPSWRATWLLTPKQLGRSRPRSRDAGGLMAHHLVDDPRLIGGSCA